MMRDGYELIDGVPQVQDFCRLRRVAGLSPKTEAMAARGLPNTIFGAVILHDGRPVAMGRVIGDGGTAFQIVDMAVEPGHQGQGLGHAIMARLMVRLRAAHSGAYVSLIADGPAHRLYARHGFAPTAPASIGMAQIL